MGRVKGLVIIISLMLLAGASYPLVKSIGTTPAAVDGDIDDSATATPTVVATATSPRNTSIEEAVEILSKLKPPPGQGISTRSEIPVQLPKRITIEAIGVDAGFEFVGLAPDGAMDIPKDPQKVAWYRQGPRPGELGNAIVAGHVDWGGKTAVFWRLGELNPGDVVEVTAADERMYQFIVQWQRWYDADKAPVDQLLAQGDTPELTMITCGGLFDQKTRQYLSRLVVRAVRR